ncbi:MAG: alpha/beta hydrolase-fold protein [Ignavibacteriaceae bacterium]
MKEEFHQWYTNYLNREFSMLVFGHDGYPVILFPTSKGHYYENKDFGLIDAAAPFIEEGKIKVYCPDSIDEESWYNYSIDPADRVKRHIGYEEVILHDIIEFALHETGRDKVGLAGCSFGAYHAANLAFRHPDKVGYLICMSGSYNIKQFIMGHYDENCYFNNPPDYLPNLTDKWYLDNIRQMGIVLGTGEHDICLEDNKELSGILNSKGIKHWLDIRRNALHDWHWWKEMFNTYLAEVKG